SSPSLLGEGDHAKHGGGVPFLAFEEGPSTTLRVVPLPALRAERKFRFRRRSLAMTNPPRRVIAGLDANGKSCIVSEEAIPQPAAEGMAITTVTTGPIGRTDNSRPLQAGFAEFSMSQLTDPVYSMMFATYPPGLGKDDPGMHFTNTADHFYIIEGECVL